MDPDTSCYESSLSYSTRRIHYELLGKVTTAKENGPTPSSTPALSFASSITDPDSEDDMLELTLPWLVLKAFPRPRIPPHLRPDTSNSVTAPMKTIAIPVHILLGSHSSIRRTDPPYYVLLSTYVSYVVLIVIGHMRDWFGKRFWRESYKHLMPHDGYAALNSDFDSFYTRRLKTRLDDCFSRPVTGVPGRTIVLLDRATDDYNNTFKFTGTHTRALNVSSYNYLGFAQARGGCADAVEDGIRRYGVNAGGTRLECGTLDLHIQAESLVARFLGQEDALVTSMGFATNSTTIPALVGKGCLVISDEFNHASIRYGVRLSGASVRMFKHNDDPPALEEDLGCRRGLYSMEGSMVNLLEIMELKRRYKFFLYVDEAHSIGALGPHGRGVADYFGVDPREIDILMGTFTKSFGASGGYISGSKAVIDRLRLRSHAGTYCEAIAPAVLVQIIASMGSIMGISPPLPAATTVVGQELVPVHPGPAPAEMLPSWLNLPPILRDGSEGLNRLRRLAFNSRYLARGLRKLGFIVYGHTDSPIVPLLIFNPGKMHLFSHMMLRRETPIVVVVVAYPATPLVTSRVRFCLSAAHTKEDIDEVLRACDEIGDALDLKHGLSMSERWTVDQVIDNCLEIVKDD
ncbi:aminotransferase class I and II protein [Rhizoctonia solani]|uniref:serine C-palmitoyltransferase n=1 Tax=Rhizoctonia solani TaxID=456999 RepID=A0A8H8P6T4_9AGAM|nr:aminotransferase class I and II protein [Rhizoctonia solani]QRW25620.1 aminotransferase class I and II protein [Rhizoctonia solani]